MSSRQRLPLANLVVNVPVEANFRPINYFYPKIGQKSRLHVIKGGEVLLPRLADNSSKFVQSAPFGPEKIDDFASDLTSLIVVVVKIVAGADVVLQQAQLRPGVNVEM